MQELIEKIGRNFLEFFRSLEPSKKIGLIFATIIVLVISSSIIIWAGKTRFSPLYTDLNKEDSQKIAALLEEKNIPYQTVKDGTEVHIPEDMVGVWRIKIATMGMEFSGSVGYEVFDKQSFGTSSFVQRVNRQRALEGELIRTIRYISGVSRARVHLNIPEDGPFVTEKRPPSASVVLDLEAGVKLSEREVQGISSLVASSIEGMRPENVIILDDRGKKLSENIGDPMTAYTANRMALEAKLNRRYENQIEDILSKVVGNGRVMAKVSASLDFTESVATETSFDQENAAVLSEVENKETMEGRRPSPQGLPGARSNIPGEEPQPGIPETRNNVNKNLTTKNYNVPSKVVKSKRPTAGLKTISAAVMIDGKRVPVLDESGKAVLDESGHATYRYAKWSADELKSFEDIVSSTLGLKNSRGDTVVIKNMEFIKEDLSKAEAIIRERENRELLKSIAKYLSVGLIISLFFFMVLRPFIQWVTDNTVESVEDFLPKTLEELEKVQANQKLPGLEDALPQIEEKLNPEKIEGNMLREKIISLVESNPGKAAQVLHEMIHSNESDKHIA